MTSAEVTTNSIVRLERLILPHLERGHFQEADHVLKLLGKSDQWKSLDALRSLIDLFTGICHQKAGELHSAERALGRAVTRTNSPDIRAYGFLHLSKLYFQMQRFELAAHTLEVHRAVRRESSLFSQGGRSQDCDLPFLWRRALRAKSVGQGEAAATLLNQLHASIEDLDVPTHQLCNYLSAKAIVELAGASPDWDAVYSLTHESRVQYFSTSGSTSASSVLWPTKAAISTLLVEAMADWQIRNYLSSYTKLLIVREFLKQNRISPLSEGFSEVSFALQTFTSGVVDVFRVDDLSLSQMKRSQWLGRTIAESHERAQHWAVELRQAISGDDEARRWQLLTNPERLFDKGSLHRSRQTTHGRQLADSFEHIYLDDPSVQLPNVRVGIARLPFKVSIANWPPMAVKSQTLSKTYSRLVDHMLDDACDIICFPEFAIDYLDDVARMKLVSKDRLIAGGTRYVGNANRSYIFVGGNLYYQGKVAPSDYEDSEITCDSQGMKSDSRITVFHTVFGRIVVLVCRDLLTEASRLIDVDFDILIVSAYNPTSGGNDRLIEAANYLVSNKPVYVLLSEGGLFGKSVLLGRIHKSVRLSLVARGFVSDTAPPNVISELQHQGTLSATLNVQYKWPIVPSPARSMPNITSIKRAVITE